MRLKSAPTKRLVKYPFFRKPPLLDETMLVHRAVALAICTPWVSSVFSAVKRPREDPDFPGEWGVPACTLLVAETINDAIRRIGKAKLGVSLDPGLFLATDCSIVLLIPSTWRST